MDKAITAADPDAGDLLPTGCSRRSLRSKRTPGRASPVAVRGFALS